MLKIILEDITERRSRIAIAAVLATVILDLMMKVGAPNLMGIPPMSPAGLITNILGLPTGNIIGVIGHYGLGLVVFPIGYVIIGYRYFPGPMILRGLIWGVFLWIGAMVIVVPLAGQPVFFGGGKPMMASLLAHIVYGAILAVVIGPPDTSK